MTPMKRGDRIDLRLSFSESRKLRVVAISLKRTKSDAMRFLMLRAFDELILNKEKSHVRDDDNSHEANDVPRAEKRNGQGARVSD